MHNNFFKFKQFTIHQDKCGMKTGTDGVLLGAWVNMENAKNILDVGTGTGLIAIMLAQRSGSALIEGIELESNAFGQAKENILLCPWSDRIHIQNISFQIYSTITQFKFDLIVCNPPYFKNSLRASDDHRNKARHSDTLSNNELLKCSSDLLSVNGRLSVILPFPEGCTLIAEAARFGLFCIRKTQVKTKRDSQIKRLLLEFSNIPKYCSEDYLIIGDAKENSYTLQFKELTKDFYLAF